MCKDLMPKAQGSRLKAQGSKKKDNLMQLPSALSFQLLFTPVFWIAS
jgi:hypothetical protein